MAKTNPGDFCVSAEATKTLYDVRRELIWAIFRLSEGAYDDDLGRDVLAMNMDHMVNQIDRVLSSLGVDLSSDYFNEPDMRKMQRGWM